MVATAILMAAAVASPGPAPANAAYFADCLAAAAAERSYQRDGRYLLFTCHGATAQAFFGALGSRPASVAYAESRADGLYRFTEKPKKNTEGLDYCRESGPSGDGAKRYACVLIYPAGAFLDR